MEYSGHFRAAQRYRILRRFALAISLAPIVGVAFITPAHAYIDPGSAAIVTQMVIGAFAATSAYIGHKFKLFRNLFSREKGKEAQADAEESNR